MSIKLTDLIADLQSEVPAVNSVPTTAQYEKAIKDAVLEFGRRCGQKKTASLSIVSGVATYAFPSDFLKLIMLVSFSSYEGVILGANGIIPLGESFQETFDVIGQSITFYPTPAYTMTREYEYKAGWVLSGADPNEAYTTMGDDEAQIVLIKAKQLALEKVANKINTGGSAKYSFGAVSVDKGDGVSEIGKTLISLHGEFVAACEGYNGAVTL